MGHDYIDIGTSHLRLNDFHIWTLHHFFCDAIATSTPESFGTDADTFNALQKYLESWEWLGPGIVTGCDFNSFATTPSRLNLLRTLISATRERLTRFGDAIPLSYLDDHVNSSMAYYLAPQPTATFTDIIDRLLALISQDG
ncbi:hypothetical protein CA85_52630 [Allorhodopirellula solitaria]|uniref:Uncharacterized protein n=1 Tax=Allorhodopirellula solitaria TaxID=2527987 RepID=A0A5C5WJ17_9BACT|nr:hypothetical protein CA85_52630 [Allorhodopirellula solitaria]